MAVTGVGSDGDGFGVLDAVGGVAGVVGHDELGVGRRVRGEKEGRERERRREG